MKKPIIAVWISLPVLFGASAGVSGESWICHKANLSREVLIIYPGAPKTLPCSVFYTKPDENTVPRKLWEASNSEGYCENKATEFVRKLESWGWRCMVNEPEQSAGS